VNTQLQERTFPYVMLPADECTQRGNQPAIACTQVQGQ
jgi:hypothetical protein